MRLTLFLILILSNINLVFSKTIARVSGKKGNAFVFYGKNQSAILKYGDKITDLSEIMVEDDSYLTLMNYEGHTYFLSGGSHVKFFKNVMELKSGKVWVRSENSTDQFLVQSVNASASYTQGQFVFSFSNVDGKSQLLVLEGEVGFNNILTPQIVENLSAGFFSMVDKDQNNGLPRVATRVGLDSYTKVKLSFAGIEQIENSKFEKMLQEAPANNRNIANIENSKTSKKGKLYFYNSKNKKIINKVQRNPSSENLSAINYFEKVQLNTKTNNNKIRQAIVNIFGGLDNTLKSQKTSLDFNVKVQGARTPASIETISIVDELNNTFESSLKKKIKINKRHPNEVNQLINDLKSFDKNYQKNY